VQCFRGRGKEKDEEEICQAIQRRTREKRVGIPLDETEGIGPAYD
jgi:hypothetical protein